MSASLRNKGTEIYVRFCRLSVLENWQCKC